MNIKIVFGQRNRTNSVAARLRKNMVAAITTGNQIELVILREMVACREIGMTHEQCFMSSGNDPVSDVVGRAKELGITLSNCGLYLAQWPDSETLLDFCLKEGIMRLYFENGSPSGSAVMKLKRNGVEVTRVAIQQRLKGK